MAFLLIQALLLTLLLANVFAMVTKVECIAQTVRYISLYLSVGTNANFNIEYTSFQPC